ncbi:hypothetical protein [Bradyrhizobium sp. LMG 9283]|uniref:hypothetical protein n=1 Tax=Bradyrhizobium sp. LMG 9283 TaxID=592064 RepID=UPI00388D2E27
MTSLSVVGGFNLTMKGRLPRGAADGVIFNTLPRRDAVLLRLSGENAEVPMALDKPNCGSLLNQI